MRWIRAHVARLTTLCHAGPLDFGQMQQTPGLERMEA